MTSAPELNSTIALTESVSPSSELASSTVTFMTKFESTFLAEPSETTGKSLIVTKNGTVFSPVSSSLNAEN